MGWIGLGNGIPWRTGGGTSWSTYWLTLISAIVDSDNPADIVLTFDVAGSGLTASDFTVAGYTVSGLSYDGTGKIITLTCTANVLATTVTFNKGTGLTVDVIVELVRNSDVVECGGYPDIIGSAGQNLKSHADDRKFLNLNNNIKIRVNGTITSISFYTNTITNTTKLFVQFWRKIDGTYTLMYEEDVISKVSTTNFNTITLTTPYNAQEGDMIGFWAESSADDVIFEGIAGVTNSARYNNGVQPTTGYAWDSALGLAFVIPVKSYGQAPLLVSIGDSIIAGHPYHYSYREDRLTDNKLNSITGQLYLINNKYICQNMGDGGDDASDVLARITTDLVNLKPKIAIINPGVNDIADAVVKATYLSNCENILDACSANEIIPVWCKILPWTNGTNEQMQTRDDWMADLETLVATYAGSVWVDFDIDMGKNRVGGDDGNLWDLQTTPDYDLDGVHPTLLGYTKMAEVINREVIKKYSFA